MTNKQLATELAALGPISRERLQELLPTKREKQHFLELMQEIESERTEDEKLAFLSENLQTAGKVALRVLKFLV